MYPMILKPAVKNYIWGGSRLKTEYNKKSEYDIVAESWELSCHKDGLSIIDNGELKGISLLDYAETDSIKILGTKSNKFEYFPVLVKLIDAKENLSIQVHPDNDYAVKNESQYGKTEMWYIVDCEPGSYIYYGFNRNLTKDEFIERINNNTFLETLNAIKVKKGDVFFIEAGTLHAICGGILIAEVQQNSNLTYRIYDYNRLGSDGKPRELHINKAVDVTNINKQKILNYNYKIKDTENYTKQLLSECQYFKTYNIKIKNELELSASGDTFHCLLCLNGNLIIDSCSQEVLLDKGQTVFIPANMGNYKIKGKGEMLFITL